MTASRPMVEFRDVTVLDRDHAVLDGFTLTVHAGERVLLWGRSGSGKSTLLNMVLGFVRPASGEVLFDGRPVNGHTVWNVRRRTAFVSQDYQLGGGIARDILTRIAEFKANRGMSLEPEKVGAVCDALELAGRLLDKPIGDLSGGERQRLALLAALLLGREVFLLDEVTSALDPALKRKVVRLLLDQPGVTLITASHDEAWLDSGQVRTVKLEDRP